MGAVAIDTEAKARKLDTEFPMHTREGVEVFLTQYNHTKEAMYTHGDYDALVMLIDLEIAMIKCKLSDREREVLQLVFVQDMKRVDVAKQFNVTKQTIQKLVERGTEKIAKYYQEMSEEDGI